ncbi:ATP-binding protein [Amycolatopsis sp. NPDC059021]|uniref:ATP-binding protein n=1 Tax=Amycolatopsis sp. NPDC059021 TaxID=3346704 RepID=UPI00366F571F
MTAEIQEVRLVPAYRAGWTIVTATGVVSAESYPWLRDGLLRLAAEAGDGLIADIDGLRIDGPGFVHAFKLVAARIADWPEVPFGIVTSRPEHRALLTERSIGQAVSIHADADTAMRALGRPARRRAEQELPRSDGAPAQARGFVRTILRDWNLTGSVPDAELVASELVENTLRHTGSRPRVRLELRGRRCAVAVADDEPGQAVLRERLGALEPGLGLRLVAGIAKRWGCSRSWTGGKVVWAILPAQGGEDAAGHRWARPFG